MIIQDEHRAQSDQLQPVSDLLLWESLPLGVARKVDLLPEGPRSSFATRRKLFLKASKYQKATEVNTVKQRDKERSDVRLLSCYCNKVSQVHNLGFSGCSILKY